jgi:hypothetical protein
VFVPAIVFSIQLLLLSFGKTHNLFSIEPLFAQFFIKVHYIATILCTLDINNITCESIQCKNPLKFYNPIVLQQNTFFYRFSKSYHQKKHRFSSFKTHPITFQQTRTMYHKISVVNLIKFEER